MKDDELNKVVSDEGCCNCSNEDCGDADYEEVYIDDPHYASREEAVDGLRKVVGEMWSLYYRHRDITLLTDIAKYETAILENLP